ncbi:MAG: helix-turn-helix transcriptional regulator [Puia sp.]|nr:helix-turn-helix transcriptional regulator [Puia sp.]
MEKKEIVLQQFGRRLRTLREQRNLSPGELAKSSGMEAAHLVKIEEGRSNPLFSTILALARGLGVEPGELLK